MTCLAWQWQIYSIMAQSLNQVLLHLVFSTKDRAGYLDKPVKPLTHAYLAEIARNTGCECLRAGGMADHVHLAITLSRTITIADLVEELKKASSKWIKTKGSAYAGFAWQRGYGVFSVNPNQAKALVKYIDDQEEHHRTRTFQEEYRMFLKKYAVSYDERYVWD